LNVWVRNIDGGAQDLDRTRSRLQIPQYAEDDWQEITQITFSSDGTRLVFLRGGNNDAQLAGTGQFATLNLCKTRISQGCLCNMKDLLCNIRTSY
jgi:hypothetical protein